MPGPDEETTRTLADRFLKHVREAKAPISVYLVNGFQLKGEVLEYDEASILFSHKSARQLIMRSSVASMYPLLDSRQDVGEWWRTHVSGSA